MKNMTFLPALLALLFTFTAQLAGRAQNFTPDTGGDHGGLDWSPDPTMPLAGIHSNINRFLIPTNVTVLVKAYDGGRFGQVTIYAQTIEIHGTLDGAGKGPGGGGGGGGGGGADQLEEFGGEPGNGGAGGAGAQGGFNPNSEVER